MVHVGMAGHGPEVEAVLAAGRAAWPAIEVDAAAFIAHAMRSGAAPAIERAGDLYLAFACSRAVPAALHAIEPLIRAAATRAARRIDRSSGFVAEVAQDLRETLFVARPPRIASYAGRAALRTWLATAAARVALNLRRRTCDDPAARTSVSSGTAIDRDPGGDIRLAYLRERHRGELAGAVRAALAALSPRDRALLRQHRIDGATLEQLAAIHRVGKSSIARWIDAAQHRLAAATRSQLCERLRLTAAEYDSLVAAVRSDVDVSLARLLGDAAPAG